MNIQQIVFTVSLLATIVVGYYDYQTGAHISMMLLYTIPILTAAWVCGKVEGIIVALLAAASWFLVNFLHNPPMVNDAILSWNAITRLGIFILIAYTISLQTKLRQVLEREKLRANTDSLTGLLNKEAFQMRVEEEMFRMKRYNHVLSIAFIDLDNFKQINDSQGHARGDILLQQVSETFAHTIRRSDFAGRIGGDEFTICFPETGEEQIRQTIKKLMRALASMTSQSGWQVTASIGVVTCKEACETYDAILGKADKLMYAAKDKGKNAAEFMVLG